MIQTAERRVATRMPASGPVEMFFANPMPMAVRGSLLDSSSTGFRVQHDCTTLDAGLEISYSRNGEIGHARVVWTMISGASRVSGVMIL